MGALVLGLITLFLPVVGLATNPSIGGTAGQGSAPGHASHPAPPPHGSKPVVPKPPVNGQRPPNGNNRYNNYVPQVYIDADHLLATPAPVHTPKAHATKRPANAPEVFSAHSSDE